MVSARVQGSLTVFCQGVDEKAREYNHLVYICFLDLRNAYDSMEKTSGLYSSIVTICHQSCSTSLQHAQ